MLVKEEGWHDQIWGLLVTKPDDYRAILDTRIWVRGSSPAGPRLGRLLIDEVLKVAKGTPTRLPHAFRQNARSLVEPLACIGTRGTSVEVRTKYQHVPFGGDPDTRRDHFVHAVTKFSRQGFGVHRSRLKPL